MKKSNKTKIIAVLTFLALVIAGMPTETNTVEAAKKPAKVTKVTKAKATENSLKIKISKVKKVKGYQVRVYKANKSKVLKNIKTKNATVTIKGLSPNTNYTIKVRAYTKSGKKYVYGKEKKITYKTAKRSTVQKPSVTPEPAPQPTEVPIVRTVGTVDDATYKKAVGAFETIVKKMRADGIVKSNDVCVTMDATSIKVDITFDNFDVDLQLSKDNSTNIYTLTFDYDFTWIEGLGPKVNEKDPALYNKELIQALLSIVSDEPQVLYDRIDLDCYSPASLSNEKWTEIGDCFIKGAGMVVDQYISYNITKEAMDTRDASYVLTTTTSQGATVECEIEYDSSLVSYELIDNNSYIESTYGLTGDKVTYMHTLDETKVGPNAYPAIKEGCTSYENYKQMLLDKFVAQGGANRDIVEYTGHRVNGYTYHWLEGFYSSETTIGDPDIVYVQIGENEYIELYNVLFQERFEDFINGSFYIRSVKKVGAQ